MTVCLDRDPRPGAGIARLDGSRHGLRGPHHLALSEYAAPPIHEVATRASRKWAGPARSSLLCMTDAQGAERAILDRDPSRGSGPPPWKREMVGEIRFCSGVPTRTSSRHEMVEWVRY